MSELDKHYRKDGEEHQRRAIRLKMNWYQGNITKYAERAPHKGVQNDDLVKVLDYTTMWLESTDKETNPIMLNGDQRDKINLIATRLLQLSMTETGNKVGYGSVLSTVDYADNRRQVEAIAAGGVANVSAQPTRPRHPYDGRSEEGSTPD